MFANGVDVVGDPSAALLFIGFDHDGAALAQGFSVFVFEPHTAVCFSCLWCHEAKDANGKAADGGEP